MRWLLDLLVNKPPDLGDILLMCFCDRFGVFDRTDSIVKPVDGLVDQRGDLLSAFGLFVGRVLVLQQAGRDLVDALIDICEPVRRGLDLVDPGVDAVVHRL